MNPDTRKKIIELRRRGLVRMNKAIHAQSFTKLKLLHKSLREQLSKKLEELNGLHFTFFEGRSFEENSAMLGIFQQSVAEIFPKPKPDETP